jgi:hypothetical protein
MTTTTPMSAADRLITCDSAPLTSNDVTKYRNIVGGLQVFDHTV